MANYPTKLLEVFANNSLQIYYAKAVTENITNTDYEGEIKGKGSILNLLTFSKVVSHTYTGANMGTPDALTESNAQLVTDQAIDFYFQIKSYDKFRSYIKNPEGALYTQTANELKKVIDAFVLGKYTSVAAGHRIGVIANAGTVTVTTGTGAVVGSGTNFVSGMINRGFQAAGQTNWYRITAVADTTHMTIVDDLDDTGTGAYTGGTVSGGTAYTVEAVTPVQLTKSNIYDYIKQLGVMLDLSEVPDEDRWLVIDPNAHALLTEAPEYIPSGVDAAYEQVVKKAQVKDVAGFAVWKSPRVVGTNSSSAGLHGMAGHKSAITFAMGFVENGIEDAYGNFGKNYKALNVFGAKVADERRKALTEIFYYK